MRSAIALLVLGLMALVAISQANTRTTSAPPLNEKTPFAGNKKASKASGKNNPNVNITINNTGGAGGGGGGGGAAAPSAPAAPNTPDGGGCQGPFGYWDALWDVRK